MGWRNDLAQVHINKLSLSYNGIGHKQDVARSLGERRTCATNERARLSSLSQVTWIGDVKVKPMTDSQEHRLHARIHHHRLTLRSSREPRPSITTPQVISSSSIKKWGVPLTQSEAACSPSLVHPERLWFDPSRPSIHALNSVKAV